jgi:hypothetical protein
MRPGGGCLLACPDIQVINIDPRAQAYWGLTVISGIRQNYYLKPPNIKNMFYILLIL